MTGSGKVSPKSHLGANANAVFVSSNIDQRNTDYGSSIKHTGDNQLEHTKLEDRTAEELDPSDAKLEDANHEIYGNPWNESTFVENEKKSKSATKALMEMEKVTKNAKTIRFWANLACAFPAFLICFLDDPSVFPQLAKN
jgi:hypothetical protein